MKIKTIWHYAFAFFENQYTLQDAYMQIDGGVFYKGKIADLSYKKASKIAQIHPNCISYYANNLMPLFQGKRKTLSGTEDPVLALESYKTASESSIDMPFILIWKIFK